jgi:hypothetical protein
MNRGVIIGVVLENLSFVRSIHALVDLKDASALAAQR